jgi:3'-phosphoadenosine 5'-phosphosulfate sulfotransferase (PAPS reductase)/FAD synthetase
MHDKLNIVNISGGKDSTATLLLAKEQISEKEPMIAVFCDTGHEHPITYEYVAYLSSRVWPIKTVKADFSERIATRKRNLEHEGMTYKKWIKEGIPEERISEVRNLLVPTGNPWEDLMLLKGRFPDRKNKFCTEELKIKPITSQVVIPSLDEYEEVMQWLGERAEESPSRAKKPKIEEVLSPPELDGLWLYRPILHWTWQEVFDMHDRHNTEPNPLYALGMGRVGCMPCINACKPELFQISTRFPEIIEKVLVQEQEVSKVSKTGNSSLFHQSKISSKTPIDITDVAKWAKTKRGGKERNPEADQPPRKCDSMYGLCE